jgi:malonyl-CoA O-methyltransferase
MTAPTEHLVQPDRTLEGYERWAASYDQLDNPLVAATAWVLDRAPLDLTDRDLIELGCGTGRHALYALAHHARSYTGVDGSPAMLAVARGRTTDPRVTWLEADLRIPWTPPRTFDAALVVLVLEHLTELATLAATLARAVRPGGTLRIVDLHPDRIAAGAVAHFHDGDTLVKFASVAHPAAAVCAALEAAGFSATAHTWLATDELLAAVPRIAKHRGQPIVLDVTATRR